MSTGTGAAGAASIVAGFAGVVVSFALGTETKRLMSCAFEAGRP
jgi:hypothetical protein